MTKGTRIQVPGRRWLPLVLAAVGLGAVAGCGGEERLSREAFQDRLQRIDRRESARFERLAQRVGRVKEDQPLPDDVKQSMTELAAGNRQAADELDELHPPQAAQYATEQLIEALRERAEGFEQAAREERITLRELEDEGSITQAGEKIDRAFERLRADGFLPQELASAATIDADPYAIACGHVRDQQEWADVTRRATVALADRERLPDLNRLQATQSLFFAMTELCKARPASFEPAKPAVEAVRAGKYRADLGAP